MSNTKHPEQETTVPLIKLFVLSTSAIVSTLLTVFLLILPAAYNFDPTGIGAKFKINGVLALTNQLPKIEKTQSSTLQESQQQSFTLQVPAQQNLQFSFYMQRDYDLDYHWATDGVPLYTELRGQSEHTPNNTKIFGTLTESKGKGFFIPPFSGNYTLFWHNKTTKLVTVHLTLKGAYKILMQNTNRLP